MLDGAAHAVLLARFFAEEAQNVEVDGHLGELPSGRTTPPWEVPVWMLILLMPWRLPALRVVAFHEGVQVFRRAVLLPTSPISPPIEIVKPFGSWSRMKRVKSAHSS